MPQPTRLQLYFALISVAVIAFIGGITGFYFASETAQTDYLTNILLSFCAGLLVSLVFTFIIQNILTRLSTVEALKHQQIANSTAIYERFHSPTMIEMRCRIDRLFRSSGHLNESLNELHERLYILSADNDEQRDWIAISSVLHFYEGLADLIERDLVDRQAAVASFAKYFRWLRANDFLRNAIELSRTKGEEWFFMARFDYLEREVGF